MKTVFIIENDLGLRVRARAIKVDNKIVIHQLIVNGRYITDYSEKAKKAIEKQIKKQMV